MERLFREIGLETSRIETDPVAFAADPDFPGAEMPRESFPVVVGRLGRPGGRRLLLVGHVDVVPSGRPRDVDVGPVGRRRPRRGTCTGAGPAT